MVEPAGSPSSDVLSLLCEVSPKQFMTAFQESEWATAYFLCNKSTLHPVLTLEPHNPTILEFKRLLPLKLKQGPVHLDMQEEAAAEEEAGSGSEIESGMPGTTLGKPMADLVGLTRLPPVRVG